MKRIFYFLEIYVFLKCILKTIDAHMWDFFFKLLFSFSTFCFFTFPSVPRRLTEKIPRYVSHVPN